MPDLTRFDQQAEVDTVTCVRETLADTLQALPQGATRIRIPPRQERLRPVAGLHFHLWPELFLQISGMSLQHTPGGEIRLYPGEMLIMPRGVAHTERTRRHRGESSRNVVFMYAPGDLRGHVAYGHNGLPRVRHLFRVTPPPPRRMAEYLQDAAAFAWEETPHRHDAVRGLMLAHLEQLFVHLEGASPPLRTEHPKVLRCRELVMTNLTNPDLTVSQLARWIHCAPDYLSHLFATEIGVTLKSYINEQRIRHARDLLVDSPLNVSEVARATGYADPGYFSRVFRRLTGRSPRQYRSEKSLPR